MSLHSGELRASTSLIAKTIAETEDLLAQPELLIDIAQQPGLAIERWREARAESPGWSEGVVELHYGDILLTDARYWDDVWPLWSYILAMIDEYLADGVGQFAFPKQDVHVVLRDRDGGTYFSVGDTELDVHARSLIVQLLDAAEEFFNFVLEAGESDAEAEIDFIAELREQLE